MKKKAKNKIKKKLFKYVVIMDSTEDDDEDCLQVEKFKTEKLLKEFLEIRERNNSFPAIVEIYELGNRFDFEVIRKVDVKIIIRKSK